MEEMQSRDAAIITSRARHNFILMAKEKSQQ